MPNPIRLRRRLGGDPHKKLAATMVAASSQFGSIADNASVSFGTTIDWTVALWVNFNSVPASDFGLVSKWGAAGAREYRLYKGSSQNLGLVSSSNGTLQPLVFDPAAVVAGTWYFVVGQLDATANTISLFKNAVSVATPVAVVSGTFDGTNALQIGAYQSANFLDGRIDSVGIWKSATGGGGLLTAAQQAKLYRAGLGASFADLDADLKANLVAWYDFDGTPNDAFGTNHLTNNGAFGYTAGKR